MVWYSIFVADADAELTAKCQTNCVGQLILWDGKASKTDADRLFDYAKRHAGYVTLFRGKMVGKLVIQHGRNRGRA